MTGWTKTDLPQRANTFQRFVCLWSIGGNTLRVEPAGSGKPVQAGITGGGIVTGRSTGVGGGSGSGIGSGVGRGDVKQMLERRTPSSFRFNNAPLGSVTDALGKVCDMDIRIDESDKARIPN